MIFETSRLCFRKLRREDFDDLYRMYSDPAMREFFPEGTLNKEDTHGELEWFADMEGPLGLWATILKSSGEFVGRCGLLKWEIDGTQEIEIAYMIDKPFWQQGLGSEAARGLVEHGFRVTDADRLIALTDHRHTASIQTARAAGLTYWKDIHMDGFDSAVYKVDRP